MAQKIYVIMKGRYSDIHVEAATTNQDRAEELMRLHSDAFETAWIEEFDDGQSPYSHVPVKYWSVALHRSGTPDYASFSFDVPGKEQRPIFIHDGFMLNYIQADTQEQAIKIARDERARLIALREGIA